MAMEVNPLTEEKCSRIINTLLDSFNGSKVLNKSMREVRLSWNKDVSFSQVILWY